MAFDIGPSIQPLGRDAIVALSPWSWFTSSLSVATNTSPPECFQLSPSITTTASQSQISAKAAQFCWNYLSRILSHPAERVPPSQQHQLRPRRRTRRSSHPRATAAEKRLCSSIVKSSRQAVASRRFSLRDRNDSMATTSTERRPSVSFHMETRSRTAKITPEQTDASTEQSSPSSLSSLSTPPSTPPKNTKSRKRKFSDAGSDGAEHSSKTKRLARQGSTTSSLSDSATPRKRTSRMPVVDSARAVADTDSAPSLTSSSPSPPESAKTLRRSSRIARSDVLEAIQDPSSDGTQASSPPNQIDAGNVPSQKPSEASPTDPETPPKPARASQSAKETTATKAKISFQDYKDKELWPEYDAQNPTYYANDATTRYRPAENGDTPESRSPRKPARGGGRGGRGGAHANGGGRGKGKSRGRGGRAGGESPEPPNRRRPLTQEEKLEISIIKARQLELKRFFSIVGAQQVDILDQLSGRDASKIARKPKAHRHVPEYDSVVEEVEATMRDVQDFVQTRYDLQVEHEKQRLQQEKEVIEAQFKNRVTEARKEHLAGAEGDIILFERAYRAAHDDTHTESGSDMDYFPHYHELPEPNTQPRGYSSRKIMDEKPFKQQLESYDEQARQQVLNEDVIGPLLKQMEQRNNEWRTEQLRKKSQTMDALSAEAAKELENIKGYLIPRPLNMGESSSYALSALADVSDWVAQQHPERQYIYMPLAQGDVFPKQGLDFSPLPGQGPSALPPPPPPPPSYQVIRPDSRGRGRRSKFPPQHNAPAAGHVSTPPPPSSQSIPPPPSPLSAPAPAVGPASFLPPRLVSSGLGQPIAPAPPKPAPPHRSTTHMNVFRHSPRPSVHQHAMPPRHNSLGSPLLNGPQQFIFQPPQQPYQHQSAPGPAPTPQYSPHPASPLGSGTGANSTVTSAGAVPSVSAGAGAGSGVGNVGAPSGGGGGNGGPTMQVIGQQTKIPMTFVNQTIASRNAAAAAAASAGGNGTPSGNGGPGNGKRVLLPKM
ncbi:uncharacterized protein PV07_11421 [Cladophialophora immunda]|uniref:Uncharacterized protein n=1 Tax=Cladophialophora immunda TaxID=569365 RepID=A0A0D1Z6F9_9EURO|nr:uncharacterized protein PV07_11421 [Cladophialophora immunda]KIW23201.1 hypothetical protein PV07_11421 [Cladophialophora immunda]OQV07147.1 hypothetical protein CLAIMM_11622 [Cladophialophora immunda]